MKSIIVDILADMPKGTHALVVDGELSADVTGLIQQAYELGFKAGSESAND